VSYFQGVRLYAALESIVFSALLVVWIGGLDEGAKQVLGWVHGFGWILLSLLVLWGWFRRIFPGPLLAATVSPLGPIGALIGFEVLVRYRTRTGNVPEGDVPAQPAKRPDAGAHPAGAGARGGAARGDAERVGGGGDRVRRRGVH
jgi:hypothetical protein